MIIFFMLVDTLFTQWALKCKKKIYNTDHVLKCRKCAIQMMSSYGREARNDQSNRRTETFLLSFLMLHPPKDFLTSFINRY